MFFESIEIQGITGWFSGVARRMQWGEAVPTNSIPSDAARLIASACPEWEGYERELPTDEEFDRIFSTPIRKMSAYHWSTVDACRQAADWLVTTPQTRVLDIGCGPGKFCAIGAMTTPGHFTGVEQRGHLCRTARKMLARYRIERASIIHANVIDLAFDRFDAFYLFNPFEENLNPTLKIDDAVPVCSELYDRYINHVHRELSRMRSGTRVVTFWGDCDEIPSCYDCVDSSFDSSLKLWVKRREK